jgi:hypothetical protein
MGGANHFPWGKYLPLPSKQCHCPQNMLNLGINATQEEEMCEGEKVLAR